MGIVGSDGVGTIPDEGAADGALEAAPPALLHAARRLAARQMRAMRRAVRPVMAHRR
jgi:ABC-type Fe3+ transport system permease subunit